MQVRQSSAELPHVAHGDLQNLHVAGSIFVSH